MVRGHAMVSPSSAHAQQPVQREPGVAGWRNISASSALLFSVKERFSFVSNGPEAVSTVLTFRFLRTPAPRLVCLYGTLLWEMPVAMDALPRTASITDILRDALSLRGLTTLVLLWIAYRVAVALYNISPFHPLSRFPGPKIAAATYLYEAYYDWILVGRYGKVIKRMHDKYGA